MSICYITGYGKKVRVENGVIAITSPPGESERSEKVVITPADLSLVVIAGDHGLTTGALRLLLEQGTEFVLLDRYGRPAGYLLPGRKSPVIENAERQRNLPAKKALAVARAIVKQAIHNKFSLVRSMIRNSSGKLSPAAVALQDFERQVDVTRSVASLLGVEGSATREYYLALRQLIPASFGFTGRTRHPPRDPVNSLFSYGYGILYAVIRTALVRVNLSPFYGVLHADYKNQEALVYDFIEEFRQPLVDRVVLTMINRHQIDMHNFTISREGCLIRPEFRKVFAEAVLERLDARYEFYGQPQPFSAVIDRQAELLADALLNGSPYLPFEYR